MANLNTDDEDQEELDSEAEQSDADDAGDSAAPPPDMPEESEEAPKAEAPAPVPPAPAAQPATGLSRDEILKNYLEARRKGDEDITAAQDKASKLNNVANIGDALESIFKANSMAHGGAGVDSDFYKGLKAQGQVGIQQAQAKRNAQVQDFLQQHEIQRQVAQDMMTKGTWEQQQKAAQFSNDLQDPTSRASQNAQTAFKSIFKDEPGIADLDVSKFSASDLASASKNADVVAKLNEIKATKQMQMAYQQSMMKDKRDLKQDQIYTDMNNRLTNPRGNTAVQQAQVGILSGKKAMDLINMYPDANKMPAQQVSLLAQEISKVASGGVGSEHGQQSLEANTFQSNWNKFISRVKGEPTGADLAGFINENKRYLVDMLKTNNDTILDYKRQVYNGSKKRLTPEQDAQFRADNPDIFKETEMGQGDAVPTGPSPMKKGGGQIVPAWQHPQADDAKAWALANPNNPKSAEILKRLGTMNASNSQ